MGGRLLKTIKAFCFLFTFVLLIVMFTPVSYWLASPLVVAEAHPKKADIIAVLGGGAYKNGALGSSSNERLIKGLMLLNEGYADKILFSGGPLVSRSKKLFHTLFEDEPVAGGGLTEAELMREAATSIGIPEEKILLDTGATNTYENLKAVKEYMEDRGLKSCVIVTGSTHMKRASLVAKRLGLDFSAAPVKDYTEHRDGAIERLGLLREAAWEYAALALYRFYGYI